MNDIDVPGLMKEIAKLRKEKGMTQQQMADKLGLNLRTYQNYENHTKGREAPAGILLQLCKILEVDLTHYLFTGDTEKFISEKELTKRIREEFQKLGDSLSDDIAKKVLKGMKDEISKQIDSGDDQKKLLGDDE